MIDQYLNIKNIFLLSLIAALLLAATIEYVPVILIVAVLCLAVLKNKYRVYPVLMLIGDLSINSDLNPTIRAIQNTVFTIILFYFAFEKASFNYKKLPQIPKVVYEFIIFITISTLISAWFSTDFISGLQTLLKQTYFFLMCFSLYVLLEDNNSVLGYYGAIIFSAVIISISILVELFQNGFAVFLNSGKDINRFSGYFNNLNGAGFIIFVALIISVALFLFERSKKKNIGAFCLLVIIVVISFSLILTNSRAALLGGIAGVAFVFLYLKSRYRKQIISGMIIITLLGVIINEATGIFAVYLRFGEIFSLRDYMWKISLEVIRDYPIWGVGPEMFCNYIYKYMPLELGSWGEVEMRMLASIHSGGHSHNLLLFRFAELGIPGLVSVLWLFVMHIRISINTLIKYKYNNDRKYFVIACVGVGIGIWVRQMFEGAGVLTYGWITTDILFWINFTILLFFYMKEDNSELFLKDEKNGKVRIPQ